MNYDYRDSLILYFADKQEQVSVEDIKESRFSLTLQNMMQDYGLQRFAVLDQIHAKTGFCFDQTNFSKQISWFEKSGDFLITNQSDFGLAVLTADCVPLVLYDPVHKVVGLVHAGWKGAYLGVAQQALSMMHQTYGSIMSDIECIFGPSARECCYEVTLPFVQDFEKEYPSIAKFVYKDSKWYFDNNYFLQQLLKKFGIVDDNIYTNNALCTVCNPQFCSFRKDREKAGRQITMVALLNR